jgi:predicted NUDIX family phosphoesterase
MKHAEHIFAIRNSALLDIGLHEGLNEPCVAVEAALQSQFNAHFVILQRAGLEKNPTYKQLLPYTLVRRKNRNGDWTYMVYQRAKGVGESRLLGNLSLGLGGHVDIEDVVARKGVINYKETVRKSFLRELQEELIIFKQAELECSAIRALTEAVDNAELKGYLFDHSDEVGTVHFGVVNTVSLHSNIYCEMAEPELEQIGWLTVDEVRELANNSEFQFESWSKLCMPLL